MNWKLHRLIGTTAAAVTLGVIVAATSVAPLAAQEERDFARGPQNRRGRQLRIVKDCSTWSGVPGNTYCVIKSSNIPELPPNAKIYYNQLPAKPESAAPGPTAGPGYLDSTIFIFVNTGQWAVGRCTVPNDDGPGICTISDGFGWLAGFTARIDVKAMGNYLYSWDGWYNRE